MTLHKIIITHITFYNYRKILFKQFKHMMHIKYTQLLCKHLFNYCADTQGVSAFPLKGISPRDYRKKRMQRLGTWIGSKKVGKISLEKIFSLPSSFFYCMMIPLDFVHFNFLPSSTSFFGVKNLDRILLIR